MAPESTDPGHIARESSPKTLVDLCWRLSGDPRRAAVVFLFLLLVLGAGVAALALVAPYIAAIVAALGGVGLVGGGTAVVRNYRQRKNEPDDSQDNGE